MSSKRYPEEFRIEAVKQVTERGHSVAEVASRVARFDRAAVLGAIRADPAHAEAVIRDLSHEVRRLRALLELRSEFEGGPATVRAEMTRAAALVLGGADGGRALRAHLAVDSPDVRVAMQLLDGAASTRGRVREAVSLTRLRPEHARRWGAALLAGEAPPAEVMAELENETGWAASMLAAGAELQRQRPGHALGILAGLGEGDRGDAAMLLRAEAGAESGRWDAATDAITRLEQDPDADPVLLLGALRGTQQLGRAYALAESLLTEFDPDVETLLLASEIALQLPEPRDAELFLQTASELDPFDERVYAALLGLYAPGGPLADESQMTRLRRLLRENRPNGVLAALYDARDMAEDGLVVEAEARLREIALRDPDEPGVYELLLRVWSMQRAVNAEDPVLEDAAAWLMERLAARPGSPPIGAALARVFVELGRPERAVQVLEEVDRRIGAPVLASMREQIIARDLGEPERAREMSLARLDRPALSIDDAIARAFLEAQGGDAASSLATLESSLPAFATLTTDQRTRLGHVATAALVALNAGDLSRDDLGSRAGPVLAIIDLASDRGAPLSDPVLDGRLRIAALDPGRDADELSRSARDLRIRGAALPVEYAVCDLTAPGGFESALDRADAALDDFDAFVITAALFAKQDELEHDAARRRELVTVNFTNTVELCEAVRARLLSRGGGTLCVFSSVAGDRVRGPIATYATTKAALSAYLEGLDLRDRRQGLNVVTVKPGFVKTSMTEGEAPVLFAAEPEPVARAALAGIDRGRSVVYTPSIWRWIMFAVRLAPRALFRRAGR